VLERVLQCRRGRPVGGCGVALVGAEQVISRGEGVRNTKAAGQLAANLVESTILQTAPAWAVLAENPSTDAGARLLAITGLVSYCVLPSVDTHANVPR